MPLVTIRIENDLPSPTRVSGVVVEFYNTSGVFQTSGTTDSNGEVTVTLPDATYDVAFYKAGVSILPRQPQRIVVDSLQSNVFLVTSHERVLPESTDPLRCRVSGNIFGSHGLKTVTKLVMKPVKELLVLSGNIIAPDHQVDIVSDETGYFEFDLLRGVQYEAYFVYLDILLGQTPGKLDVQVPSQPGIELDKLLFPVPVNLDFSENTKALLSTGGDDESITYILTCSDGSVRSGGTPWSGVIITNTDTDVVEARLAEGKLVLTPKAAGVATISTQRVFGTKVVWSPAPAFATESVVVTVS